MSKTITRPATSPANEQEAATATKPVLIVAVGRQRVGKTTFLNVLAELYRANGARLGIWNADLHNRTHSLSNFHGDALEPAGYMSMAEQQEWIEERLNDQMEQRFDAILDVGGGMTALNMLIEQVRLVAMLERNGIRPVLLYVLGNEAADLDYLERLNADDAFMPEATIIAFNEGLLTNGKSGAAAFEKLIRHPAVIQAITRGAKLVRFPNLSCMAAVTDRNLSFTDFAEGKQAEGFPRTSFFDQERVWLWLHKSVTEFFAALPPQWMPALPAPLTVKG